MSGVVVHVSEWEPYMAIGPFGPVHHGSANHFPRKVSKTMNLTQGGLDASVHCWLSGSGNAASNAEQKTASVSAVGQWKRFCAFVGREAMSAITLSVPGTCTVMSGPA